MVKHAKTCNKIQTAFLPFEFQIIFSMMLFSSKQLRDKNMVAPMPTVAIFRDASVIFDSRGEMLEAKSAAYHKAYERLSRADCEILGGRVGY